MPIEMAVSFFHPRRYVGRELPTKSTKEEEEVVPREVVVTLKEDEDSRRFVALPSYTAHGRHSLLLDRSSLLQPPATRSCIFLHNYARDHLKIYHRVASSVLDPAYNILRDGAEGVFNGSLVDVRLLCVTI